jgi:arsenate reductase (thioredoxin)
MSRPRVLFLCTHNSARSQMAEGFLRSMAGDRFEAGSAGTERTSVNPLAIRAMAELGIDIGHHTSKLYESVMHQPWDYVITVCDNAKESCPLVPGSVKRLHWSFADPSQATGDDAQRIAVFREVRDQIRDCLTAWLRNESPG